MVKKAKQKRPKGATKKATAKAKLRAKKEAPKRRAARKPPGRSRPARPPQVMLGSESVETVQLKDRARVAAAGAGGGDFGDVSAVEGADSESPEELLEEGQTFEAGIVSGVENAPDPDQDEVRTHEVAQDDVPEEYDDKDNPAHPRISNARDAWRVVGCTAGACQDAIQQGFLPMSYS